MEPLKYHQECIKLQHISFLIWWIFSHIQSTTVLSFNKTHRKPTSDPLRCQQSHDFPYVTPSPSPYYYIQHEITKFLTALATSQDKSVFKNHKVSISKTGKTTSSESNLQMRYITNHILLTNP